MGFQTYAWSNGQWDTRAQLQQWANGQWGDTVDFTRAVKPEYGQTPVTATPPVDPKPDPDPKPEPEPEPPILTPDAAGFWQRLFEWLRAFFKEAK